MPKGICERTKIRKDKGVRRGAYGSHSNYPFEWVHSKHQNVLISGRQKLKLPPLQILKWLFRYDSESGKLYKIRESSGRLCEPEREITYASGSGYLVAGIRDSNGLVKLFFVHQLIYFMHSGVEPLQIVDHINGDKLDNRFENLRLATETDNSRNRGMSSRNTSGITGIHWNKPTGKWRAMATDNTGKFKHLGYFDDIEEAAAVVSAHYANPLNNYSERHGL